MVEFRRVTDDFWVAPQVSEEDVRAAAAAGFRTLVSNRPDGEEAGQPSAEEVQAWAEQNGMAFLSFPVSGMPTAETALAQDQALTGGDTRTLAFCRTGTRSIMVWALAQSARGRPRDELLEAGAAAGYDLSKLPI